MGFFFAAAIWAASWLYGRVKGRHGAGFKRHMALSKSPSPTVTEGKAIPIVFGKCKVTPSVAASYDGVPEPIIVDDTVVGYKYHKTMQYVVCMGRVDSIDEIHFDDKRVTFQASLDFTVFERIYVDAPILYGTAPRDGVGGYFDFYYGGPGFNPSYLENTVSDYLEDKAGVNLPAYRHVAYAVMRDFYFGNSPNLPSTQFVVSRYPHQGSVDTTGYKSRIGDDANPANIIFDILTNPIWGCSVPESLIDLSSFNWAREWLYDTFYGPNEQIGMSFIVDEDTPAEDVIEDVLRHIDGALFIDPFMGQYRLILIRTNYPIIPTPGPSFSAANADDIEITSDSEQSVANVIRVHYLDRNSNYGERVAQLHDLASIETIGERIVQDVEFMGISTALSAQKIAARELRAIAYPLRRCRFKAHRKAFAPVFPFGPPWTPMPGSPFTLDHPAATNTLFRITHIDSGDLTDGTVTVEGIEDVFNVDWIASGSPIDSDWIDPASIPTNTAYRWIEEPPLNIGFVPEDETPIMCFGSKGTGGQMLFMNLYLVSPSFAFPGDIIESPTAVLLNNITETTTSVVLTGGSAMMASIVRQIAPQEMRIGLTACLIVAESDANSLAINELCAYSAITYDSALDQYTVTLVRGCCDTTPRPHSAGQRVWFFQSPFYPNFPRISPTVLFPNVAGFTAKLRPVGPGGATPLADCTSIIISLNVRSEREWLPTNIRIDGNAYPSTYTGDLSLTWEHRSRFETSYWTDAHRSPSQIIPATIVYRVRYNLNGSGTVARTVDNLNGTSTTYTLAEQTSDNGGSAPTTVRVRIDAHPPGNLTLLSWTAFDKTFTRV